MVSRIQINKLFICIYVRYSGGYICVLMCCGLGDSGTRKVVKCVYEYMY